MHGSALGWKETLYTLGETRFGNTRRTKESVNRWAKPVTEYLPHEIADRPCEHPL